jgi:Aminomethyltransferase folate-binding domain
LVVTDTSAFREQALRRIEEAISFMWSSSASSSLRRLPASLRRWNAVRRFATQEEELQKTAFYELHQERGGDMVPFAGYWLPILYKGDPETTGILKEHLWCRSPGKASLFDVSHMGQVREFDFHWKERSFLDSCGHLHTLHLVIGSNLGRGSREIPRKRGGG